MQQALRRVIYRYIIAGDYDDEALAKISSARLLVHTLATHIVPFGFHSGNSPVRAVTLLQLACCSSPLVDSYLGYFSTLFRGFPQ